MKTIIEYIRYCFCKHDWEMIFNGQVNYVDNPQRYYVKVYRCKKCGYSKQYEVR